jgi:hypothetical protein
MVEPPIDAKPTEHETRWIERLKRKSSYIKIILSIRPMIYFIIPWLIVVVILFRLAKLHPGDSQEIFLGAVKDIGIAGLCAWAGAKAAFVYSKEQEEDKIRKTDVSSGIIAQHIILRQYIRVYNTYRDNYKPFESDKFRYRKILPNIDSTQVYLGRIDRNSMVFLLSKYEAAYFDKMVLAEDLYWLIMHAIREKDKLHLEAQEIKVADATSAKDIQVKQLTDGIYFHMKEYLAEFEQFWMEFSQALKRTYPEDKFLSAHIKYSDDDRRNVIGVYDKK